MKPAERIPLLKKLARALASIKNTDEIDLILRQFGFTTGDVWGERDEHGYIVLPPYYDYSIYHLENSGEDAARLELERYLDPSDDSDSSMPASEERGPWKGENTFRLFVSHTHSHARFAGDMRNYLKGFLVESFVAHDDIEPSEKWLEVIESALLTCHAAVALVTPGFRESAWCDQEIGFCLARSILIVPLMFDIESHGFLGGLQGVKLGECPSNYLAVRMQARKAGEGVFDILAKRPETRDRMVPSVIRRYSASRSFDNTRAAFTHLRRIPKEAWTLEMIKEVEEAAKDNSQVEKANLRTGTPVPEAVEKLLAPIKKRLAPEPEDVLVPVAKEFIPYVGDSDDPLYVGSGEDTFPPPDDDWIPPQVTPGEDDFIPVAPDDDEIPF